MESPEYVAVRLCTLAWVKVSKQLPAATVPVQESVPSLTVTLPVGAGKPTAEVVTAKLTVIGWPTTAGLGASDVILVKVPCTLKNTSCEVVNTPVAHVPVSAIPKCVTVPVMMT